MKLHSAFVVASHALAKRDFVPHYQHFMVRNGHVTACDERVGIRVLSTPDSGINACMPGAATLAAMSDGAVVEHVGNGIRITSDDGKCVTKLPTLPTTEYPLLWPRPVNPCGSLTVLANQFGEALATCLAGAGRDEERPELLGVTIHVMPGHVHLFASDNITITNVTLVTDGAGELPPFILPDPLARALAKVCVLVNPLELAKLVLTDTKVFVNVGEDIEVFGVCTGTAVADQYKIIHRLLADTDQCTTSVPTGFDVAVKSCDRVLGKDSFKGASFTASGRSLHVSAAHGDYTVDNSMPHLGDAHATLKFDPKLLMRRPRECQYMALTDVAVVFTSEDVLTVYAVSAVKGH